MRDPHGKVVLLITCWSSGQIKEHLGICKKIKIKNEGVEHGESVELSTQYFDFGNLVLVSLTPSGTKGFPWHRIIGRNKSYLFFTSLQPEHTSKAQGQAVSTPPQKAFTKVAATLNIH